MHRTVFRRRPLALAVAGAAALLAQPAAAQSTPPPSALEPVVIRADPLDRTELDLTRPVSTLGGDALRAAEGTNLGDTLSKLPGVQSSAYGAGAGRPIIRGMDSSRVRVTESGLGVADVSSVSPDHRVAADTLNARQVEVLRGPATLLYGSGAIGGLVNVVSERVPLQRNSELVADFAVRGASAERERAAAVDLQGPLGGAANWRIEGFKQRTSDYELAAPLYDSDGNLLAEDRLPNSQTDTRSLALGASWFGGSGTRIGAAVQRYESDYGIPNPEEPVTIELQRDRYELHADSGSPFGPFDGVRSRFAYTDYAHEEVAPDGSIGARFSNRGGELRIELPYRLGDWRGVLGTQLQQMRIEGSGEGELPRTESGAAALFVVTERRWGALRAELGLRGEVERYEVRADYADGGRAPDRRFTLGTASAGLGWNVTADWDASLTLTSAQRAPQAEELYFVGAHPATFAFEIGNPALDKEHSNNIDLVIRYGARGPLRGQASLFASRVRRYIYGFFDGSTTDILDENGDVEESLSTLRFEQADARLRGAEIEIAYGEATGPQARLWGDTVRAELDSGPNSGANLPRMAPTRLGLDLGFRRASWLAQVAVTRVFEQDRVSSFDLRDGEPETSTPGYTRVDALLSWQVRDFVLSLQARNLTDQVMRVHTSFLKDFAPLPGRSFVLGLRASI